MYYSGGGDCFNIKDIVDAGIWPVTVATTLLKTGGYQRLCQIAQTLEAVGEGFDKVNVAKAEKLAIQAVAHPRHTKAIKPIPKRKIDKSVPLSDCFFAPCQEGCPIHQDITTYMQLVLKGEHSKALKVIAEKNPLPFITETICAHNFMNKCTRTFKKSPVRRRK